MLYSKQHIDDILNEITKDGGNDMLSILKICKASCECMKEIKPLDIIAKVARFDHKFQVGEFCVHVKGIMDSESVTVTSFAATSKLEAMWSRPQGDEYIIGSSSRHIMAKFMEKHFDVVLYYYTYRISQEDGFKLPPLASV
jgi:hypothetical protein